MTALDAANKAEARRLAARAAVGGAMGIALWCFAEAFRVLPMPLADITGVALGGVLGLVIGASPFRPVLPILLCIAASITLIVSATFLSEGIAARWVRINPLPEAPLDAVIALSEGLNPDTTISSVALDHLLYAAELVRSGRAKLLITTTTAEEFPMGSVHSEVDQGRVVSMLGDTAVWLRTGPTRTTREEAVQAKALLRGRGIRRVGVVTSPIHTRRACATFEAVGFEVTCLAARAREHDGIPLQQLPRDRMVIFGEWIYEVAATAEYSIRGWL